MKKAFKWIGILLLGFALLIIAIFGISYYYRSDILQAVNNELKKNIDGDIHIGGIDFSVWENFPAFSITLKNLYLRGSNYSLYHADFLHAEKVSLDVEIASFLQKKIVIRSVKIVRGDIFIFRTKSGYSNLDIFKTNVPTDTAISNNSPTITFRRIFLHKVNFTYRDSLKQKSFGVHCLAVKTSISQRDSSTQFSLSGSMNFDDLTLNSKKGSFLKNQSAIAKLNLEFVPIRRTLVVHPSLLTFGKSDLVLSGDFEFEKETFSLKIQAENLDYAQGLSLLTQHLQVKLKKFIVQKPISLSTVIAGSLTPGEPSIDLQFHFSDSRVLAQKVRIEHATVAGSFSNHAGGSQDNGANTLLTISSFSGNIEGLPTTLTATFHDLRDPFIKLQSKISLSLPLLNEKVDSSRMKFLGGDFKSEINYSGKLSEYLDPDKTKYNGDLHGIVTVKNGAFDYLPRKQHLDKIDASLRFTKDSVVVNNMALRLNKNPLSIQGHIIGFVPFFHQPEKKGYVRLMISSPTFDLSTLLLKSSHKKLTASERLHKNKTISETLDKLYTKVEFDLRVSIKNLLCRNFKGSDLRGRLLLNNNSLKAVNMKIKLADGNLNFTLGMNGLDREMKKISVVGTVDKADIGKFFYAFNNFNQTAINHKNLEGSVAMNVNFDAAINDEFTVLTPSMTGDIDLSIKDGKLNNFEPLQKMSIFLFKNRDFENVQFGEINTRLTLAGTEIDVERMEVESSVLRLFLQGRYSLGDSTDLSIQLPLSNLKKRDKNYHPKNIGVDTKAGPSIFLHVYKDPTGKTVFAYDPFKRHVKK